MFVVLFVDRLCGSKLLVYVCNILSDNEWKNIVNINIWCVRVFCYIDYLVIGVWKILYKVILLYYFVMFILVCLFLSCVKI